MLTVAWVMLAAVTIVGCMGSTDADELGGAASPSPAPGRIAIEEPCPGGVTLSLGAPFRGRDYAKFQTLGGTLYISVRQLTDGGRSTVYIGALARPPTFDPHSGEVRRAIATTSVVKDTWSAIDLAEGRYWLTAAGGWDIVIRSCKPGGLVDGAADEGT